MVPKESVEDVRKVAARQGVVMSKLSATWNHVFHKASADAKVSDKQKSMMDRAKASGATMAVGMMAAPRPPMVEYALTKDAEQPGPAPRTRPRSRSRSATTRYSQSPHQRRHQGGHVRVERHGRATGAPATLMWWPGGKMAGTVQHEGRIYSIRHMGGEMHAVVEMGEDRMPQEHAPCRRAAQQRPQLRDDPLVQQGDASMHAAGDSRARYAGCAPSAEPASRPQPRSGRPRQGASAGKDVVIDVIVAYTKKAASNYSDVKRELVELSIEEANESFRTSGLGNIKLRLVHAYQTDYVEEGAHFDHVWRFADKGDGYMEEIHPLRNKYKADVAHADRR